jgi:hypothetical protein
MDKEVIKKVHEMQCELIEKKGNLVGLAYIGTPRSILIKGEGLYDRSQGELRVPDESYTRRVVIDYKEYLESRIKELQDALDAI